MGYPVSSPHCQRMNEWSMTSDGWGRHQSTDQPTICESDCVQGWKLDGCDSIAAVLELCGTGATNDSVSGTFQSNELKFLEESSFVNNRERKFGLICLEEIRMRMTTKNQPEEAALNKITAIVVIVVVDCYCYYCSWDGTLKRIARTRLNSESVIVSLG